MIRKGESWGNASGRSPDLEIAGSDADLAGGAAQHGDALVWFQPDESDFARALGLAPGARTPGTTEVAVDMLRLGNGSLAVNAVVIGTPPDRLEWVSRSARISIDVDGRTVFSGRATTVLIANGQFLRGLDVVPRGHPGDGRAEVQVYSMRRGERRLMRARLATGTHVPHPRIGQWAGRGFEVRIEGSALPVEVDRQGARPAAAITVEVLPGVLHLLV